MITLLLTLLSMVAAVVPMVGFLTLIWWLDRYEREPVWLVSLTFLWGAIGAIFLALIGNFIGFTGLAMAFDQQTAELAGPVIIAPLVEEPVKAIVLFAVIRSRNFDNMTDGFVYGAAAGLGFGMTENFVYFSDVGASGNMLAWMGTVVVRTLYSALMHACATSCVGAALGWARLRGGWALAAALPTGFVLAMGMHALWNGLLTADAAASMNGQLTLLNLMLFPVEFLTLFAIFQVCLWRESGIIERELVDEASQGVIPREHPAILSSALQRAARGWAPRGVPQGLYVTTATTLAFRRVQARNTRGAARKFYDREVSRLRGELQALLAMAR